MGTFFCNKYLTRRQILSDFKLSVESSQRLHSFGFPLLCSVIRLEESCNTKTNHDLVTRVFPRFRSGRLVFTLSSHWLLAVFLIGRCYYFGFGFTTTYRKDLKVLLFATYIECRWTETCGM